MAHKVERPSTSTNPPRSVVSPLSARSTTQRNVGLGQGSGGQLARNALGAAAYASLDPVEKLRQLRREPSGNETNNKRNITSRPSTALDSTGEKQYTPCLDNNCILLLSDQGWGKETAVDEDLELVRAHRWTFRGAVAIARQGKSHCFFVRCLLEMQQNIQCDEEGEVLQPALLQACKIFVSGQCGSGRSCEVYQLLSHFISNSVIFDEWEKFLGDAFDNPRANQEAFLVPHLEQVWSRFCRLVPVLEEVFGVLDTRFVWRHRLPRVGDLVREHMKRRCFSKDSILKNDLYAQEKLSNETIKNIKRTFKDF